MSAHESFDIAVEQGVVSGAIVMPEGDPPHPAVLVCSEFPGAAPGPHPVLAEIIRSLTAAGIAVSCHAPRTNDDAAARRAMTLVDDAAAVLRWLMLRDDVDANRVGLLGFRLASMVAACLTGRTERVRRVCLLEATTSEELEARLAKPNGSATLLNRDEVSADFVASLAELRPVEAMALHRHATLLLHGAADTLLPPRAGRAYLAALEDAGHPVAYELVARLDGEFTSDDARVVCCERIRRFFAARDDDASP